MGKNKKHCFFVFFRVFGFFGGISVEKGVFRRTLVLHTGSMLIYTYLDVFGYIKNTVFSCIFKFWLFFQNGIEKPEKWRKRVVKKRKKREKGAKKGEKGYFLCFYFVKPGFLGFYVLHVSAHLHENTPVFCTF